MYIRLLSWITNFPCDFPQFTTLTSWQYFSPTNKADHIPLSSSREKQNKTEYKQKHIPLYEKTKGKKIKYREFSEADLF